MPSKTKPKLKIPAKSEFLAMIEKTGGPGAKDTYTFNGSSWVRCCWYVCDTQQCSNPCQMVDTPPPPPPPPPPCTTCWQTKTPD